MHFLLIFKIIYDIMFNKRFFKSIIETKKITSDNQFIVATEHTNEKSHIALRIYGEIDEIKPFDEVIFEIN